MKKYFIYLMAIAITTATLTGCGNEDEPDVKGITMTTQKSGIGFYIAGSGTMTIDWGDGTSDTHTLSTEWTVYIHDYSGSSAHTVRITGDNITGLECSYNQLTALNVSKNTALTYLSCSSNQLTALDVNKNTALAYLECASNKLTALDVSKNTALTYLDCWDNQLTALDVSKNTALIYLDCCYNKLTALDMSKNTALEILVCNNNQLTATALNNLFGTLHGNTISGERRIFIGSNPGRDTCDQSIAENKGWYVGSYYF